MTTKTALDWLKQWQVGLRRDFWREVYSNAKVNVCKDKCRLYEQIRRPPPVYKNLLGNDVCVSAGLRLYDLLQELCKHVLSYVLGKWKQYTVTYRTVGATVSIRHS